MNYFNQHVSKQEQNLKGPRINISGLTAKLDSVTLFFVFILKRVSYYGS